MKKNTFQRIVAFVITWALVISFVPFSPISVTAPIEASAAGSLTTTVTGLTATWTDASNGSGKAEWTASGNTITGTAKGYTQYYVSQKNITTKLTLTNNLGGEAVLKFSYSLANGGSVSGVSGNAYEGTLANGASITITLTSPKGTSTNTLTISNISLTSTATGEITTTFKTATGGSYTVDGAEITETTNITKGAADSYTVIATASTGYKLFGWYNETAEKYLSDAASTTLVLPEAATVYPVFIPSDRALFGVASSAGKKTVVVGSVKVAGIIPVDIKQDIYSLNPVTDVFYDLQDALDCAAAGSSKFVVLMNNGTLPARKGGYNIPAGVTLLIPFDDGNTYCLSDPCSVNMPDSGEKTPSPYRTLTMADGATINVSGTIEVAAKHYASHGGKDYGGRPVDKYGHIDMQGSSEIILNSGANLYAWGYITGSSNAQVVAEKGSTIHEKMQVADYRGGTITSEVTQDGHFPFSQYYIQNVEVKEVIKYGSNLKCYATIYASAVLEEESVSFMGNGSMFTLGENAQAVKYYDANTDRLIVDVKGGFSFNSISLMGEDTSDFVLPLQQNLTINLESGAKATVDQDIMLQPGCQINVGEGAELTIASGKNVYLMDMDQWGNFCSASPRQLVQLTYIPSTSNKLPVARTVSADATVNVNGTVIVEGQIYASAGHASIKSTGKTGVVQFKNAAGAGSSINLCSTVSEQNPVWSTIAMTPAVLTNTDGSTVDTKGTAAGTNYHFHCEIWQTGKELKEKNVAPTCTEAGSYELVFLCTECNEEFSRTPITVAALGHTPGEAVVENTIAPGCTTAGSYDSVVYCAVCNEELSRETIAISATGHHYEAAITAPTCTNGGYTTYTCACGDTYIADETAAIGHKLENGVCTACGAICGDVNGDGEIDVGDCVVLRNYILGEAECTEEDLVLFDFNGDGEISILDCVRLRAYILENSAV